MRVTTIGLARIPAIALEDGFARSTLSNRVGVPIGLRRIVMEMRIVVPGVSSLSALAERLATDFGSERISLSSTRPRLERNFASSRTRPTLVGAAATARRTWSSALV